MGRIAGDDPGYTFKLCRPVDRKGASLGEKLSAAAGRRQRDWIPTEHGFDMPSVSTFLGEVMGKPASAMAWWGYRIGLDAIAEALEEDVTGVLDAGDPDALEAFLKERGVNPNMKTEEAGDRGNVAHGILENLVASLKDPDALANAFLAAQAEEEENETKYGRSVIAWWHEQVEPYLASGEIAEVRSEVPVWSIRHWYAGTFDLALRWSGAEDPLRGWEILDLKTHKPASGFTKEGKGPGYISDAAQIRAYRMAFEEMGFGETLGQRVIVARDREYKGKCWLEDTREVPESFVLRIREAYDVKTEFEKGAVDG